MKRMNTIDKAVIKELFSNINDLTRLLSEREIVKVDDISKPLLKINDCWLYLEKNTLKHLGLNKEKKIFSDTFKKIKPKKAGRKPKIHYEELKKAYITLKGHRLELANHFNVCPNTIKNYIKKYNLNACFAVIR